jgi:quinol monooxygenase YgiN
VGAQIAIVRPRERSAQAQRHRVPSPCRCGQQAEKIVIYKDCICAALALHKPREEIMFSRTAAALILAASLSLPLSGERASADAIPGQFVLVVKLEIDPAQLEPFKAAIKENGETAVRVELGCRGFSAVFEKDNPTRVRLFEIYENADVFKAHLETPHFKKYAETTKDMVKSRKRIDSVPITLNVKGK